MQLVKVEREWLLQTVTENREAHKANWMEAMAGYRRKCIEVLEEQVDLLKSNKIRRVTFSEIAPENHLREYDRVIAMLKASVEDEIQLHSNEFENYAMDMWHWKEQWLSANTGYMSRGNQRAADAPMSGFLY